MNLSELYTTLDRELANIKEAKTFKYEVPLESEQGGSVTVEGHSVVMLASNNYLGLVQSPARQRGRASRAGRVGLRHGVCALPLRDRADTP